MSRTSAKTRLKVAKWLQKIRKASGKTVEEMAEALGWTMDFYMDAEAGRVGLSAGQVNDVRKFGAALIKAAGIRDQIRSRGPGAPRGIQRGGILHWTPLDGKG